MGMMINPSVFTAAGPATPYGSHIGWRLQIDSNNGGATRTTLSSFKFYDGAASLIATTGGTSFSGGSGSDEINADHSKAFDSNDATTWSRSSTTNTIMIEKSAKAKGVATIDLVGGSTPSVNPRTCRLQYSDDTTTGTDGTWTTAFEIWEPSWALSGQSTRSWPQDFTGKWKQLRFYCSAGNGNRFIAVNELEFRATVGGADQATGGAVTSDQAGVTEANAVDDNNTTVAFFDTLASPFPASIIYSFANTVAFAQLRLYSNNDNTRIPRDFKVKGTNDGSSFTDLITQTGVSGTIPFDQTYT